MDCNVGRPAIAAVKTAAEMKHGQGCLQKPNLLANAISKQILNGELKTILIG